MDKEALLAKLNWFYSLELNQVDLYISQSKTFKGSYDGRVFERIAYIEQQHVDNIAEKINELGGTPTKLGDVISPILGSLAGKLVSLTGVETTLKANIMLEQKAMEDYTNLINSIQGEYGQEMLDILKDNLIDEDLHTAWFHERLIDRNAIKPLNSQEITVR